MDLTIPEKARLLEYLKKGTFNIPDFIYVSATDFKKKNFSKLEAFLDIHRKGFKVIARSAHPEEEFFRGGTFDSEETYADLDGIIYARKRIINLARTAKRLSILRQQKFNKAPQLDLEKMGIIVMPFIEGSNVMAKKIANDWEFGYSQERIHKVRKGPYITNTPHDIRLLLISEKIQKYLGFSCEIEYIISRDGQIHVVQAKDISKIDTLELEESKRSIKLDGIHRIRKRRNYRERPIYVMNNKAFYMRVIAKCEDMILGCEGPAPTIKDIIDVINSYKHELEDFALRHQRFGVLGLSIQETDELYQVANHYLEELPELQKELSLALHDIQYFIDYFLAESDTLLTKDKISIHMCTHDAYGIDTVRNPLWSVYWHIGKHEQIAGQIKRLGFKTGDSIGIDIDPDNKPTVYRL